MGDSQDTEYLHDGVVETIPLDTLFNWSNSNGKVCGDCHYIQCQCYNNKTSDNSLTDEVKFDCYDNSNAFSIRCGKCADIHNAQLEGKTTTPCECGCHNDYSYPNPQPCIPPSPVYCSDYTVQTSAEGESVVTPKWKLYTQHGEDDQGQNIFNTDGSIRPTKQMGRKRKC